MMNKEEIVENILADINQQTQTILNDDIYLSEIESPHIFGTVFLLLVGDAVHPHRGTHYVSSKLKREHPSIFERKVRERQALVWHIVDNIVRLLGEGRVRDAKACAETDFRCVYVCMDSTELRESVNAVVASGLSCEEFAACVPRATQNLIILPFEEAFSYYSDDSADAFIV